jgi:hypothetical protein
VQRDTFAAMKSLAKMSALFCSVLATLSLAAGFNQIAAKLDPVSQKSEAVSNFDTSAMPELPCMACNVGSR